MGLFGKKKVNAYAGTVDSSVLAQRALDFIAEGVLLVDEGGMIQFANPAAAAMSGYDAPENITGLDYSLVLRLETAEMVPVEPNQSTIYTALKTNQSHITRDYMLSSAQTDKKIAVALAVIPTGGIHDFKIITFRDITKELAEENEQAEFISTASHEMRTPVASIEGYLGLALNPQTATIDARAKQYLEAAHAASKHLGNLFKDLLDVTKLDDKRLKAHMVPVDAVETVKKIAEERVTEMQAKRIKFSFGTASPALLDKKRIEQKVYMAVDMDFLHEIIDNLVGNAIKYTPEGGEIWVNARGDGDRVLINVTDTGIGISAEDAGHVFQKFYRVDNSQTRQIGGTGLGLYLVKQRVEAMGGRVWLESAFGEGSTFFVSLPRISDSEYEKMSIAHSNEQMVKNFSAPTMGSVNDVAASTGAIMAGMSNPASIPTGGAGTPSMQPAAPVAAPAPVVSAPAATPAPTAQPAVVTPTTSAAPAASAPANSPVPTTGAVTVPTVAGSATPSAVASTAPSVAAPVAPQTSTPIVPAPAAPPSPPTAVAVPAAPTSQVATPASAPTPTPPTSVTPPTPTQSINPNPNN